MSDFISSHRTEVFIAARHILATNDWGLLLKIPTSDKTAADVGFIWGLITDGFWELIFEGVFKTGVIFEP